MALGPTARLTNAAVDQSIEVRISVGDLPHDPPTLTLQASEDQVDVGDEVTFTTVFAAPDGAQGVQYFYRRKVSNGWVTLPEPKYTRHSESGDGPGTTYTETFYAEVGYVLHGDWYSVHSEEIDVEWIVPTNNP